MVASMVGCAAPQSVTTDGRRITGSGDGVCHRYMMGRAVVGAPLARGGEPATALELENRCDAECPLVFPDVDLRQIYESLACADAVEFIDGTAATSVAATSAVR